MIQVIKANGDKEVFSEAKVRSSIKRAGIPNELEQQVINHIESKLYDNIPTSVVYKHITEFLGQSPYPYSKSKYSLKDSLMALGPTGYPFEDFVAEILKTGGYSTNVRSILSGKCIQHEIDVIAQKGSEKIMIEVKFHNSHGIKTDVQNALYTKARFDDVKERNNFTNAWLVTNTKATSDAIQYGLCVGMKIVSWSYPDNDSLRSLIEKSNLSLITALTTLSQGQKQQLLEKHLVLCKDIYNNPGNLNLLGLSQPQKNDTLAEIRFMLNQKEDKKLIQ